MLKTITIIGIIGTFAAWIGWDVYLAAHGGPTESSILANWGYHTTLFPFIMGLLLGHWFLNRRGLITSAWGWALPVMGALGGFDIIWAIYGYGTEPWFRYPLIYVLLGMGVGMLFWGQQNSNSPMP